MCMQMLGFVPGTLFRTLEGGGDLFRTQGRTLLL